MKTKLITVDELALAVQSLTAGNIGAIPTETVYGLAGNAFNEDSVALIYAAKSRPSFDPLIIHVKESLNRIAKLHESKIISQDMMQPSAISFADNLITNFWPGPLTIVLPRGDAVPLLVTSGLDDVGVRMPQHPITQKILGQLAFPLAAPSANRFGRISPTSPSHVRQELDGMIPWIIDGGDCAVGVESTVLKISGTEAVILRPGKVSFEDLLPIAEQHRITLQEPKSFIESANIEKTKDLPGLTSPGQTLDHYAPRKPLLLVPNPLEALDQIRTILNASLGGPIKISVLLLARNGEAQKLQNMISLQSHLHLSKESSRNDFEIISIKTLSQGFLPDDRQAAKTLFSTMRSLDSDPSQFIIAEAPQEHRQLWAAILDRMTRASRNKNKPFQWSDILSGLT
jgi:L-threonylcarbamoyladenylate synthase